MKALFLHLKPLIKTKANNSVRYILDRLQQTPVSTGIGWYWNAWMDVPIVLYVRRCLGPLMSNCKQPDEDYCLNTNRHWSRTFSDRLIDRTLETRCTWTSALTSSGKVKIKVHLWRLQSVFGAFWKLIMSNAVWAVCDTTQVFACATRER